MKFITSFLDKLRDSGPFWKASTIAIPCFLVVVFSVFGYNHRTGIHPILMSLLWVMVTLITFVIITVLTSYFSKFMSKLAPRPFYVVAVVALITYLTVRHLRSSLSGSFLDTEDIFLLQLISVTYFVANVLLVGQLVSKNP